MANWSELPFAILLQIIGMVNMVDKIINVAEVCRSWRAAVSEQVVFRTLDVSQFRQLLIVAENQRGSTAQLLRLAFLRSIKFGGLNFTKIAFDPRFEVSHKHLRYAYERCPNLKELALPFPNNITDAGLKKTCRSWPNLETIYIGFNAFYYPPENVFNIVGVNCMNLKVLKFCGFLFNGTTLDAISNWMPRLKVLSIRCGLVITDVTEALSRMISLEEFYISIHQVENANSFPRIRDLAVVIDIARRLRNLPKLQVYHVCQWDECISCVAAAPPLNVLNPSEFN